MTTRALFETQPGDKWFIAGQNKSGKSFLGTFLANAMRRVLVLDPNSDPAAILPNSAVVHTAADALRAIPGRVVYQPQGRELADLPARFDEIVAKLLIDRLPHGIVIHELGALTTANSIPPALAEAYRRGSHVGITLIGVSQRPHGVAVLTRSEAQHMACFTLLDPDDRSEMAALMGPAIRVAPLPLDHRFWYRGPDMRLHLCRPLQVRGNDATPATSTAAQPSRG